MNTKIKFLKKIANRAYEGLYKEAGLWDKWSEGVTNFFGMNKPIEEKEIDEQNKMSKLVGFNGTHTGSTSAHGLEAAERRLGKFRARTEAQEAKDRAYEEYLAERKRPGHTEESLNAAKQKYYDAERYSADVDNDRVTYKPQSAKEFDTWRTLRKSKAEQAAKQAAEEKERRANLLTPADRRERDAAFAEAQREEERREDLAAFEKQQNERRRAYRRQYGQEPPEGYMKVTPPPLRKDRIQYGLPPVDEDLTTGEATETPDTNFTGNPAPIEPVTINPRKSRIRYNAMGLNPSTAAQQQNAMRDFGITAAQARPRQKLNFSGKNKNSGMKPYAYDEKGRLIGGTLNTVRRAQQDDGVFTPQY